jgi:GrpB-like predicted nucleotidyltransferase (UPF0157 family)
LRAPQKSKYAPESALRITVKCRPVIVRIARVPRAGRWDNVGMVKESKRRRRDVVDVELVGGVEKRVLELVDYDERWADSFRDHWGRIRNALAGVVIAVEHIGSTSVPGLAAKPIIDIVVTVPDITVEEEYLDPLVMAGYELRVREPGHRLMRTPARDVHVHILQQGNPDFDEYLLLRDHLRADLNDRALYEQVKRALLAEDWDDMNAYAEAKTDVILAIKARARTQGG